MDLSEVPVQQIGLEALTAAPVRILTVFGTRPEAVKLAPIVMKLTQLASQGHVHSSVCVTAQHREMLDQVLLLFGITPDHDLDVMTRGQSPTQVASTVLGRLERVLQVERPDWVIVQGDTTTVASASIAAFYAGAKVAHVEAGLRTHDKWQPFPEEINRRIASVVADLHFAPTQRARQNLLAEGVPSDRVLVTGNPVIDALLWAANRPLVPADFGSGAEKIEQLVMRDSAPRVILVTAHRRENFGEPLENVCLALRDVARRYEDSVHFVYPVHLNPHVWQPVHDLLGGVPNVTLVPPLDYLPMIHLMKRSHLVLTDSGGLQEEAPSLGKPVLVLRDVTERPEGVEAGTARLVGTRRTAVVEETIRLLEDETAYASMARAANPYGDGRASERIVQALVDQRRSGTLPHD